MNKFRCSNEPTDFDTKAMQKQHLAKTEETLTLLTRGDGANGKPVGGQLSKSCQSSS